MNKEMSTIAVLSILTLIVVVSAPIAAALVPPTPFSIYGQVNYSSGGPVNDPNVMITNLNTSEVFIAETIMTSNYYQVLTSSCNASASDVLYFNASDNTGNCTEFNHTITQEEMNNGGFVQNITITMPVVGICGDVNNDGLITGGDATMVWDVACGVQPASILENPWAADVNCDGLITGGDATMIWDVACGVQPASVLNCCQ